MVLPREGAFARKIRQFDPCLRCRGFLVHSHQDQPLNRRYYCASDEAVQPMVIGLLRTRLPFIDSAPSSLGADAVLGSNVI